MRELRVPIVLIAREGGPHQPSAAARIRQGLKELLRRFEIRAEWQDEHTKKTFAPESLKSRQ